MIEIVPFDRRAANVSYPVIGYSAIEGEKLRAIWALVWVNGRCWLEFTAFDMPRYIARYVVQQARFMLRKAQQVGETEVFCLRDASKVRSAKLLSLVGFELSGMAFGTDTVEVWSWLNSEQ